MKVALVRLRLSTAVLAVLAAAACATPGMAQGPGQPPMQVMPGATPDADQLAAAMRRVGENPRDLDALLTAGELSLRLGDASGAASLFKRAEAVDPMNGRVRAGMARILVTQERPGEALRYFDQAIGFGLDPRSFAGDRGLAYDLIGEQERAQRDYRLALKSADSDEVRRRYALSLGISGKRELALAQIEPLVRRNDRGAWRARAFIMAMTGDVSAANAIATSMMPPSMAQGLQPFFARVATLPPADRAFAVHFGEVRPTPERLADARLVPALPVLGPDPDAPVAVAALRLPAVQVPERSRRERRRSRERVQVARVDRRAQAAPVAPAPSPTTARQPAASAAPAAPVQLAAVSPQRPLPQPAPARSSAPAPSPERPLAPSRPVPQPGFGNDFMQKSTLADTVRAARYRPAGQPGAGTPPPETTPTQTAAAVPAVAPAPAAPSVVAPPAASVAPAPVQLAATASQTVPAQPEFTPLASGGASVSTQGSAALPGDVRAPAEPALTTRSPAQVNPAPVEVAAVPPIPSAAPLSAALASALPRADAPVAPRMSENSILSSIVAGIPVPGAELGVAPPTPPVAATPPAAEPPSPPPAAAPVQVAKAEPPLRLTPAKAAPKPPATRAQVATPRPEQPLAREAEPRAEANARKTRGRTAAEEKAKPAENAPAGRRDAAATRTAAKDAADKPADSRRGRREAEAAKPDAARRDKKARSKVEAKPEPKEEPRIWVQVAGGAHEGDLPKAWSAAKAKAPALAKREGYSTPLRATNRVVTGPFKTEAEAQALVNQLGKQGLSAFTFKSAAGQKVTKLPGK